MTRLLAARLLRFNVACAFALSLCQAQGNLPSIAAGGVVSASAFGKFSSIAPGSWIEIYGSNLATTSDGWTSSDFTGVNAPSSLDGTKVTVGGQAAFIDYVSPGQVNAQVPSTVGTGPQVIVVTTAAGQSAPYSITVNIVEPGLLAPPSFIIGGNQNVAALFPDGVTYVLPPGAIPSVTSKRAQPGDTITLYGVGFGEVTPSIPAGQIVQQSNTLALPMQLLFGSTAAQLSYSGLAPSVVGLYQFNATVPNISGSDSVPLTFTVGGVAGTQKLFISVGGNTTPQVQSLALSASSVGGGASVQGTITLSNPAPSGGIVVSLSSSSAFASVPATVAVPAQSTSATFTISTTAVSANQSVTVTATYGASSATTVLAITPGGTLPQFNEIKAVNPTIVANGQKNTDGELIVESLSGSGYDIGEFSADFSASSSFAVAHISATFNTISVTGTTFTLTGLSVGPNSYMSDMNFTQYGITSGSITVTYNAGTAAAVGTVSGTFTLTSSLAAVSGTISGPYTAF